MRGWIYVFDHPYYTVTDRRGRFRMNNIPAGEYVVLFRQPDVRWGWQTKLRLRGQTTENVTVTIEGADLRLP